MKIILTCFLFFGLSLAHLTCNCGWRNTGRIVGGREARKNEFPWIVSIQYRDTKVHNCGGTIITPWHVVTAAHCVTGRQPGQFEVVAGRHDTRLASEDTNSVYQIQTYFMHPEYQGAHNDIALLVLASEIKYNKIIGPACMPSMYLGRQLVGQYVKAAGWGQGFSTETQVQKVLREVDLQVVSQDICIRTTPLGQYSGKQLCTYAPRQDTCPGDSGGPIIWLDPETNRYTLVALVSHGTCSDRDVPSIATDVTFYVDWIEILVKSTKNLFTCHKTLY